MLVELEWNPCNGNQHYKMESAVLQNSPLQTFHVPCKIHS